MNILRKDFLYYLLLFVVLLSGFILFLFFATDPQFQMITVILTSFFYVGFALLHHYLKNDLSVKVVIEYVLIASLGISIVYFYVA